MKRKTESSLTKKAVRALAEAVAEVVEDHRRRGIPLAVWRNGKAVLVSASELSALRETPIPCRTRKLKGSRPNAKR